MPIDTSIYGLIQQPKLANPLEQYGQAMQIRHLMDQSQLAGLQRGELEREIQAKGRLRDLFARGDVKPEEVMAISPETGMAFQKATLESKKTQAEIEAKNAAALKDKIELFRAALGPVGDQAGFSMWRANLVKDFPQFAQTVPEQFTPDLKRTLLLKGEELAKELTPRLERVTMPDGSIKTVDMNPLTNPDAKNFSAPAAMKPAEVAGFMRPTWDSERGMWITPPAPRIPTAGAPTAAVPAGGPRPAAGPTATPVPGIEPKPKLTPGQEALDREFAKEMAAFQTGGGADQAKQLSQLSDVVKALGGAKDENGQPIRAENVTGNWQGLMNTLGISGIVTPRSAAVRERVEEVVQRSLRAILGAQFTEREGERLIARAFNPYLDEKENLARVQRLFTQLDKALKAKADAAAHFEKNGTLAGWKGKMPSIADFDQGPAPSAPKKDATKGGPSTPAGGGIRFLGWENG